MNNGKQFGPKPDGWDDHEISDFMERAFKNILATSERRPTKYAILAEIDSAFRKLIDNLKNSPNWVEGLFVLRAHGAHLGAVRLAASGQVGEVYPLLRAELEAALYALHMFRNPDTRETWLRRHDDDRSRGASITEFRIPPILNELDGMSRAKRQRTEQLYERTIDLGGHPNELGLLSLLERNETDDSVELSLQVLAPGTEAFDLCLKSTMEVGIATLDIFQEIYETRFELVSLDEEVERLKMEYRRVWNLGEA